MSHKIRQIGFVLGLAFCFVAQHASADSFFSIQRVGAPDKPGPEMGRWVDKPRGRPGEKQFVPFIQATVQTQEATRAESIYARIHFFDEQNKLFMSVSAPDVTRRPTGEQGAMPVIFQKNKPEPLFFAVPSNLLGRKWHAVIVFGDARSASAAAYPGTLSPVLNYPEKRIVGGTGGTMIVRKAAIDPLVETVVTTPNPKNPQITLFFRMPTGVSNISEINGVLAMCLLADNVGSIRRQLQGINPGQEVNGLLRYANDHKLGVLCWGSQRIGEGQRLSDFERNRQFGELASAWERGVSDLNAKYGMPKRDFLLWGVCGAAQWSQRLVLRKPDYFIAAYLHIPASLDPPNADASKVLWLLTSGELDPGYQGCISFYRECQKLNYPMIFKPIAGLGHADSPISYNLAYKFFDYALSVKNERLAHDQALKDPFAQMKARNAGNPIWATKFQNPDFYGDYLNQECYAARQSNLIPDALRVPLPNKDLADLWNK
jgi:hypothetical protein